MDNNDEALNFAQRDLLLSVISIFILIIAVFAVLINDPMKKDASINPPGDLIVSVFWPEDYNDVDLWLSAPNEKPVFYANKAGTTWNLLRDDLGKTNDILDLNYENGFSRGAPQGRYTINVFCFSCAYVPVDVIVKIEQRVAGTIINVAERKVTLKYSGDWETAFNFDIVDDKGTIKNINQVQRELSKP